MIKVEITADSRFPVNRARIRETVKSMLEKQGIGEAVVSISFVGGRKMKQLNKEYMGRDKTTDVLSFPLQGSDSQAEEGGGFVETPGGPLQLGDIVVSFPEVVRQAKDKNILVDQEVDNLVIHGLEHLLGRHHE